MKNIYFEANEDLKGMKATEVVKKMGLDYTIEQKPIYCDNKKIPNMLANVRTDNSKVLGIVTERYTPVNNEEAFAFVDELMSDVTITNAGELNEGRITYLLADLSERYISAIDKEVECKLAFITNHDGLGSIRVNIIPFVDGKILTLPVAGTRRTFKAVHSKLIKDRMANASSTLDTAKSYMEAIIKETVRLKDVTFSDLQKDLFISHMFPMNEGLSESAYKHNQEKKEELAKYITGNTAMDFLVGVSTFVSDSEPQRKTKGGEKNRFASMIQNATLIDKAYKLIDKYAIAQSK